MNTLIANKLKILRKEKNLSQEEVAHRLHISQSAYCRIENGESTSWAAHIDAICDLYSISPEELVKKDPIINHNQKGGGSYIKINQLSKKLIEQFEIRLKEKENYIEQLEKKLSTK
ncbi:helix-turn-helix domain-containing protein [Polaribacter sp.]|nr:helix-turn-helix domain-containing protein [Polaribacter sp.]